MYDRAPRFRKLVTATPANVGPTTYLLTDIFDKNLNCQCGPGSLAPFNTTELRTISFTNKTLIENPSPNTYRPCFRKHRIVGGTSMQNLASRFRYKVKDSICGPDLTKEAKWLPGHIHRGVPPRSNSTTVTTIPEKGAEGYLITEDGLIKIYNPPENRAIGPTTYYNPENKENYTTFQYKGNFWSLRSAQRFKYKITDGPSPAEYDIEPKQVNAWKKYQEMLQAENQANALSMRYDDILLRKLCREDLPGPGAYSPNDPNTKKCECGVEGTFPKSKRESLYHVTEGPGPAAYTDPRTALEKASRTVSLKQSPFNVDDQRFSKSKMDSLPGPSDYVPQEGLWHDVKKKEHSRYSQWSAPFDTSSNRNMRMTKPDVLCTPGPDLYYPQFQKKGDQNRSSMFASKVRTDSYKVKQDLPGPASYSIIEPFKIISSHKSHLQPKDSAFLSSSKRMEPLKRSNSPGPDTYDAVQSSLNSKSGVIGLKFAEKAIEITPSPAHYKVHPKFSTSAALQTYNITLKKQPQSKEVKKKRRICDTITKERVKKLICFSARPHPTRHCPIY